MVLKIKEEYDYTYCMTRLKLSSEKNSKEIDEVTVKNTVVAPADFIERIKTTEEETPPDDTTIPPKNRIYWDPMQSEIGQRQWRKGNCQYQESTLVQHDGVQARKEWTGWEIFVRQVNEKKFCVILTHKGLLLRWQLQKYHRHVQKRCTEGNGWTEWEHVDTAEENGPVWILLTPLPIRDKSTEEIKGCFINEDTAQIEALGFSTEFGIPLGKTETESE